MSVLNIYVRLVLSQLSRTTGTVVDASLPVLPSRGEIHERLGLQLTADQEFSVFILCRLRRLLNALLS